MTARHAQRSATVKYSLSEVSKTIAGFLVPAATVLVSAVTGPSDGGSTITNAEWVTAVCAAVITAGTVFGVKNKPAKGRPSKPDVSETEADEVYPPSVPAHFDRPADRPDIGGAVTRAAEQARETPPPENFRG